MATVRPPSGRTTRSAARVEEIAGIFGLQNRLETASRLLSQGEKKLLDVASAFALDPRGDPARRADLGRVHGREARRHEDADRRPRKAAGVKAIILVEHDMDLVAAYSHRIIALSEGQVLADLPPEAFFADPVIIETVVGKRRGH